MVSGERFNPWRLFIGIFIPNTLISYPGLSMAAKFLWGKLAQVAGERGYCWPSVNTLSKELGITKRHLVNVIHELEEKGFIRVERTKNEKGDFKNNAYHFLWHETLQEALRERGGSEIFSLRGSEVGFPTVVNQGSLPLDIAKESYNKNQKKEEGVPYKEIIDFLNEKSGKKFSDKTKDTRRLITILWKDGYRMEQFKKVIEKKSLKWRGDYKMDDYLKPSTLFAQSNFEAYVNEREGMNGKDQIGYGEDPLDKRFREFEHRHAKKPESPTA